ncbi:type II secretion system inner membrane protein GspF [Thauera phenolivorans]|uniref:type II secretion system inner membrane protein GspF n=1 Tax=Thauera phenolivorans TaxID=1792543 RepID=UPI000839F3F4|nr:type II secretion system inner membrane protein GspF [Thauera phenolivorans]
MAAFQYRALDASGREIRGVIEADAARAARALLRERGLFPLDVGSVATGTRGRRGRLRIGEAALALLTRQWATLLGAGLTVEASLAALIEQAEDEGPRRLLAAVRSEILAGHSLRAALERHPHAFPEIYRASIAAGEKSGELDRIMLQLADHLEQSGRLRSRTLQALLYPAIVAVVALLVIVGLMTWVVPQVVGAFQNGKQALPPLTQALIFASALLRDWGWAMLLALGAGLGALHLALRDPVLRRRWDAMLLRLPLLGRHLRALDSHRFAATLAILAGSGVPLLAALEAGRQVMSRLPLQDAVRAAAERVREGQGLARALGAGRAFAPLLIHMIANGEATGRLDELLARAARLQQQELENRTAALTTLLEPVLLLTMGGVVMLIVVAVMQPIIDINTLLR